MKIQNLNGAISPRPSSAAPRARALCPLLIALGCFGAAPLLPDLAAAPAGKNPPPAGPVTFAVLSDLHLYDTKLGTSGTAFEHYLASDPKLLVQSVPILEATIADLIKSQVRFVLISGDLTKDGEILNHTRMTQHLQKLEQAGIAVFVVPGNHDLNNTDAVEFRGDTTKPVPSASPANFKALYQRFGYGEALEHAPDSLSYLAEPAPGVWLLALDSVRWRDSALLGFPVVGGRLSDATLQWALAKLQQAGTAGKKVIAFMHHGVNPHFLAEPQVFPDYLVDQWSSIGPALAGAGLRVIFTGHYHSQDVSNWIPIGPNTTVSLPLYDIETSSLVGYPCAYRVASLSANGALSVTTRRVTEIAGMGPAPAFQDHALAFAQALLPYQVVAELRYLLGFTEAEALALAPTVVEALIANYAGNEAPDDEVLFTLFLLMTNPDPRMQALGGLLYTLWFDPSPGDDLAIALIL